MKWSRQRSTCASRALPPSIDWIGALRKTSSTSAHQAGGQSNQPTTVIRPKAELGQIVTIDRGLLEPLREAYRHDRLQSFVPDGQDGRPPSGRWRQLIGAIYDRRILAFTIRTTPEQDDVVLRTLNGRRNGEQFNFFFENCADFAPDGAPAS